MSDHDADAGNVTWSKSRSGRDQGHGATFVETAVSDE